MGEGRSILLAGALATGQAVRQTSGSGVCEASLYSYKDLRFPYQDLR